MIQAKRRVPRASCVRECTGALPQLGDAGSRYNKGVSCLTSAWPLAPHRVANLYLADARRTRTRAAHSGQRRAYAGTGETLRRALFSHGSVGRLLAIRVRPPRSETTFRETATSSNIRR